MAETSEGGWVSRATTGSAATRFQALARATISAGMGWRLARMRVRASSTEIMAGCGIGGALGWVGPVYVVREHDHSNGHHAVRTTLREVSLAKAAGSPKPISVVAPCGCHL